MRTLISWLAFRFALGFWRVADLLDRIPGFTEGSEEAYDRFVERCRQEEPDDS